VVVLLRVLNVLEYRPLFVQFSRELRRYNHLMNPTAYALPLYQIVVIMPPNLKKLRAKPVFYSNAKVTSRERERECNEREKVNL
jgi:hypothetical protein